MKLFTALMPVAMLLLGAAYTVVALDADTFVSDVDDVTYAANAIDHMVQQVTRQEVMLKFFTAVGDIQELRDAAARVMQGLSEDVITTFQPAIVVNFHLISEMQANLEDAMPIVEHLLQADIADFEPLVDKLQHNLQQALDLYNPNWN
ncbi:hypothetical protein BD413DRAFT_489568 [Trametes elegans]|nr:hypothetical protein BD413DRAFT_489568 [Trametes elegans]